MGLSLRNGDYVPDGTGGLRRAEGREALLGEIERLKKMLAVAGEVMEG